MKNIEIYNTLNIDKDSSSIVATFTQEDDAVMEFKLFKDGQEIVLKDQTISLGAERKDGAVIEQDDGFLIKENNVLNITLKKNIIQVVGVVKIQLYLKDKSGEMASNTFNIRVNKKLLGAENIEATNDIKSLNTLVLELKNNTNKLIDYTKSKADKLLNGLQETGDNLSSTVKAKTDKIIEDTKAELNNIKKDYEGLKKVIIDENIGIKLQKDVTELQNGLKSNQSLEYSGSSISADNTLEGRTEGMVIKGKTSVVDGQLKSFGEAEQEGDKYKISILSNGKNLWDGTFTIGSLDTITGVESNAGENRKRSNFISIEKLNTDKITITQYDAIDPIYVHVYDENKNIIGNVYTGNLNFYPINAKLSVTLPSNAKFLRFRTENNRDLKPTSIQIEEGTQSTSYQEYISNKKDILISDPLRSIGDISDVMYEDNGQVKVNRLIGRYIFTGNENFVQLDNNNNSLSMYVDINTLNILLNGTALSNNFNYLAPNNLVNMYNDGISISGSVKNRFLFRISTSKLPSPDVNGFKAWLKANPTKVIYQLVTPVTEVVENCVDIDLDTFQDKTYFNILNSMPGNLDFKIPSNLASIVQSHTKDIKILYDLIDRLLIPNLIENKSDLALLSLK